jgi:transmembrane sensor
MKERLQYLLERCHGQTATQAERDELLTLVAMPEHEAAVNALIESLYALHPADTLDEATGRNMLAAIFEAKDAEQKITTPVHRIHFLRTAWFRYAAAVLIIFGIGAYLWNTQKQKEKPVVAQTQNPNPVKNDVAPGGNKATLTLADGTKIILDSASDGIIAKQGNVTIEKNQNKIIYPSLREGSGVGSNNISYNTMTTPRGGQYQLTLPDGSQVWLDAESSIKYPTAFTGKERKVRITGEAYFEVAKNKTKPFIVSVSSGDGKRETESKTLEIEVLGTHFNVNAYKEEPTKNITLLEGSVRLTSHFSPVTSVLTLKPGQQGQLNPRNEKLSLAVHPDIEQVMAWKNGLFNFNNVDLQTMMRQLERWYDITVQYQGAIPKMTFKGELDRGLQLSQVLEILKDQEIRYTIQGRTLLIQ